MPNLYSILGSKYLEGILSVADPVCSIGMYSNEGVVYMTRVFDLNGFYPCLNSLGLIFTLY